MNSEMIQKLLSCLPILPKTIPANLTLQPEVGGIHRCKNGYFC